MYYIFRLPVKTLTLKDIGYSKKEDSLFEKWCQRGKPNISSTFFYVII